MLLHLPDKIQIALEVVIAGDKIFRPASDRGLEHDIIIGITAQLQRAGDRHDGRTGCDEAKVLNDFLLTDLILLFDAGTPKHVTDLFEDGQRDHDVDRPIEPGLHEAGGRPLFVENGRHPNVGVKQNDGLHGAWLSLPHAPQ